MTQPNQQPQQPQVHFQPDDYYAKRYANAYRLVKTVDTGGVVCYLLGFVIAAVCFGSAADFRGSASFMAVFAGITSFTFWVVVGLVLRGLSSILQAVTDTAVFTGRTQARG